MNLRRKKRFEFELGTGAMNDIMFFLMLFFLIASSLLNPNFIKVNLPKASDTKVIPKKQVQITVTADLRYYIDKTEVAKADLEPTLKTALAGEVDPTVTLNVDSTVQVQRLVDIMQVGTHLKAKMILATQPSN
ncbi:MAG: biopolymer transporter ExbD [Sphingobacteriales bacterium JAD_PAG50586_3]|nr:MAG: biopolymer transporter ExbD [Sphingobacteriales bacterium JAD_PAG50586_3]